MTTPRTEEMVKEFSKKWHELGIPNGCLVHMRTLVAHQLQEVRQETLDEAVEKIENKRVNEKNLEEARYENGTKVERKEVKELIKWVNHKTIDDIIKALQDKK